MVGVLSGILATKKVVNSVRGRVFGSLPYNSKMASDLVLITRPLESLPVAERHLSVET